MGWSLCPKHNAAITAINQQQHQVYKSLSTPATAFQRPCISSPSRLRLEDTTAMPPLNDFYPIEPGKQYIQYDYPGDKDIPLEICNLTSGIAIFLRGNNTHYNYRCGTPYRLGAHIHKSKNLHSDIKKLVKLAMDIGSEPPTKVFVFASSKTDGLGALDALKQRMVDKKFYWAEDEKVEETVVVYGEDEALASEDKTRAESHAKSHKNGRVWKASLSQDPEVDPTLVRTDHAEKN